MNEKIYWMCVIEWDGMQPPKKWYRRLHAFGLVIRGDGDKGLGALQRRYEQGVEGAVVFQEGCILCATEDTARALALLAQEIALEFGSLVNVAVAQVRMQFEMTRTPQDAQILSRIESTLGRSGRRPKSQYWVVSCQGCGQASQIFEPYTNLCRNCSSMLIRVRKGRAQTFFDRGTLDIFQLWISTRFNFLTHWEPCDISDTAGAEPRALGVSKLRRADANVVSYMEQAPVLTYLRTLERTDALLLLDAMFISRRYRKQHERTERRLRVLQQVMEQSGDPSYAMLMIEEEAPDLVDTAALAAIGEVGAAAYLIDERTRGNNMMAMPTVQGTFV